MISWLRFAISLYIVSLRPTVISIIDRTENPTLPDIVRTLIGRTVGMFLWINLFFYIVEIAIWGHGFEHFGDVILFSWLLVRMLAIGYHLCHHYEEYLTPTSEEYEF